MNALCCFALVTGASADNEPAESVHSVVMEAMREVDIVLSSAKPRKLTKELAEQAFPLVTMGCGKACPYMPGLEKEDWPTPDQNGQTIEDAPDS